MNRALGNPSTSTTLVAPTIAARPSGGWRQFLRFVSWGVVNTVVDFVFYVVLAAAGLPVLVANLISTSAGMAVSLYGNRRFVFGRTARPRRELVLFLLVAGVGVWVIQPIVLVLSTPAVAPLDGTLPFVTLWLPKCLAIGVAALFNFFLYKHVVFRHPPVPPLVVEPVAVEPVAGPS